MALTALALASMAGGATAQRAAVTVAPTAVIPANAPPITAVPTRPALADPGKFQDVPITAAPTPTTTAHDPMELVALLASPYRGRIVIPSDARWEMNNPCGARDEFGRCVTTPLRDLVIRSGVELIGQRGFLGLRPELRATFTSENYTLFVAYGNDIRVSGIHFRGPSSSKSSKLATVGAIMAIQDPVGQTGRRVTIADNEFDAWTGWGVNVCGNYAASDPANPVCDTGPRGPIEHTGPLTTRADAESMRVERNAFHHNARDGAGYGVVVSGNAYATIWGNVFDFNRHDVTSDGRAFNGYIARFNYALQGGFTYGSSGYWGQHFDVHGSGTPESRKNGHYDGGMAGEFYEIALNTVRGEQTYGFGPFTKTRPAFELRGRPTMGAHFLGNVVTHDDRGEAVRLKGLGIPSPALYNLTVNGNRYDTDFSDELATGDFDGDGFADAFVANGTGWFFSRGGRMPWEFLRPSNKRIRDLAFADIDNDKVTDVLYRDGAGSLGYVKSGAAADVTALTTLPVPIAQLRSGDFDADGRTDLFFTANGQWKIWRGATRTWTDAQTSGQSIADLLFGEFDDVPGTDVATVLAKEWAVSRGGTQSWTHLNARLVGRFAGAVAADFDGNGRTDIAVSGGGKWRFSPDGRGPLRTLRAGGGDLGKLLVGRFAGGSKAMVVGFGHPLMKNGNRLFVWRGLGSSNAFVVHSSQNMR